MKTLRLLSLALPFAAAHSQQAATDTVWLLDSSSLTYHMTHPVHELDGSSHAAKGKGICHDGSCEFLVAAPVKSFDSGDTNRDLHMLQVVRGAAYPVITVRFRIPEADTQKPEFHADLEVTFAGQTAHYTQLAFRQSVDAGHHTITGTVPATLIDFRIDAPHFLTVPIRNEIPIRVQTEWHLQQ